MSTNKRNLSPRDITGEFFSNKNFPELGDNETEKTDNFNTKINIPAPKRKHSKIINVFQKSIDTEPNFSRDIMTKKFKTKLCYSFTNNKKCIYGENCNYAHSYDELNIKKCLYSEKCNKIIKTEEGKIINADNSNVCRFIHENESKEEYIIRVNFTYKFDKFDTDSCNSDNCNVVYPEKNNNNDYKYFLNSLFPHESAIIPVDIDYNPYNETYIKIPKNLASKAFKLAIMSGKKDIRIEVI
jgi:hypothetical protein